MNISIDIGTSYSSIFCLNASGELEPVNVRTGISMHGSDHSLPSAVYVNKENQVLVGQAAMNSRKMDPTRFRAEFKRDLGQEVPIVLGERSMLPEDMYTEIFRHLKACAEKAANEAVEKAFVTYPASFSQAKQQKVLESAHAAGLFDVTLIDEPTAAAMCYCAEGKIEDGQTLLVYDFGGGTFDAALIRYQNGNFSPLVDSVGLPRCGGIDIDRLIYADMMKAVAPVLEESGLKQNKMAMMRFQSELTELAVKAKCHLSSTSSFEEGVSVGLSFVPYSLNAERLNSMIAGLVQQTIDCCRQILDNAGLAVGDISRILLVGGTSRVPLVEQMVRQFAKGVPVLTNVNPELAVAQGALASVKKMAAPQEDAEPEQPEEAAGPEQPEETISEKPVEAPPPAEAEHSEKSADGPFPEASDAAASVQKLWLDFPIKSVMHELQNSIWVEQCLPAPDENPSCIAHAITDMALNGALLVEHRDDGDLSLFTSVRRSENENGVRHHAFTGSVFAVMAYLGDPANEDVLLKSLQVLCEELGAKPQSVFKPFDFETIFKPIASGKETPVEKPVPPPAKPKPTKKPVYSGSLPNEDVMKRIASTSICDFAVTPDGNVVRTTPGAFFSLLEGNILRTYSSELTNIAEICCIAAPNSDDVLFRDRDGHLLSQNMARIERKESYLWQRLLSTQPARVWEECVQFVQHPSFDLIGVHKDGTLRFSNPDTPRAKKLTEWKDVRRLCNSADGSLIALRNDGTLLADGKWPEIPARMRQGDIVQVAISSHTNQNLCVFAALHEDGRITTCGKNAFSQKELQKLDKAAAIGFFSNDLLVLETNGTLKKISTVTAEVLRNCIAFYSSYTCLNYVAVDNKGFSYSWGGFPKRKSEVSNWPIMIKE